ncbi:hypothetical protein CC78DRAFT_616320 [Lojkania enalia]|uniref:Uncharacterized protein n=1 Tax=Lojkania enalia TaxID=147567 RepID=A0A9P4N3Y3_9PLEO|nr:hypothetical protein CC78DRAFT_616320 [Didymosphaeria enalia]
MHGVWCSCRQVEALDPLANQQWPAPSYLKLFTTNATAKHPNNNTHTDTSSPLCRHPVEEPVTWPFLPCSFCGWSVVSPPRNCLRHPYVSFQRVSKVEISTPTTSATTPHTTDMASHGTPAKSPSRRVLGELPPQAINTPSKQTTMHDLAESMRAPSPLKQAATLSPQLLASKENIGSACAWKAGRKRSIYEVDGAENVNNAKAAFGGRGGLHLTATQPASDLQLRRDSASGSEDEVMGSPTEPNTPTPEVDDDFPVSQESQQSFSMFVNYNACESQQSEHPVVEAPPLVEEKKSRAELLKLRLGFGIYKVKTNQVAKTGAEILSTWETTSSLDPSLNASTLTAVTSSVAPMDSTLIPSITLSPAQRDVTHVVANIDPSNTFPKLVGGPVLLPTAYSSRMIHDFHLPSSPPNAHPTSVSPQQLVSPKKYRTPVAKRVRTEADENREETVEERLQRIREERYYDGDLTSSVVKGHAAKGLLELMSGRK